MTKQMSLYTPFFRLSRQWPPYNFRNQVSLNSDVIPRWEPANMYRKTLVMIVDRYDLWERKITIHANQFQTIITQNSLML